jgi:CheY-like chemotaxis protein
MGEVGEALDGDLAAGELQIHGGQVERVVGADRGEHAREDPHPGGAAGVVRDSAEDFLVSQAPMVEELVLRLAVLLEREGLSVAAGASSAAEALGLFKTLRPDISLGEESGLELARRLADDGQGDRATVILISTHADDDADLIAASSAADFLPETEVSAKTIREIVNRRAG